MKTYIGAKIVQAEPCTLGDYNARRGWTIPADENPARLGYFITYPDGDTSWSPKAVFEAACREISQAERALCGVTVITPAPSTFMSRLIAEHNELEDRLTKLGNFIDDANGKGEFELLPHAQRQLLEIQRVHMTQYLGALHERMLLLGGKREDHDAGDRDEILETRITGGGQDENPLPFKD